MNKFVKKIAIPSSITGVGTIVGGSLGNSIGIAAFGTAISGVIPLAVVGGILGYAGYATYKLYKK